MSYRIVFRRARYTCGVVRRAMLSLPSIVTMGALPKIWPGEVREGIRVIDPMPQSCGSFINTAESALALLAQATPARFRRVQREIRAIVNLPVPRGAEYRRFSRLCLIDFRCFPVTTDPEYAAKLFACALVHEASHGYLERRKILQTKRNHSRIECFCCREASRLGVRLGMDTSKWPSGEDDSPLSRWKAIVFAYREAKSLWG